MGNVLERGIIRKTDGNGSTGEKNDAVYDSIPIGCTYLVAA